MEKFESTTEGDSRHVVVRSLETSDARVRHSASIAYSVIVRSNLWNKIILSSQERPAYACALSRRFYDDSYAVHDDLHVAL